MRNYILVILSIVIILFLMGSFEGQKVDGDLYTAGGVTVVHGAGDVGNYMTAVGWTSDEFTNCTLTDSGFTGLMPGVYGVSAHLSVSSSQSNYISHSSVFINDTEDNSCESERTIATGSDVGAYGPNGRITVASVTDIIKVKIKVDKAGTTTLNHGTFTIERLR